jgi:DNA-binding IclR family transcriptional regulator
MACSSAGGTGLLPGHTDNTNFGQRGALDRAFDVLEILTSFGGPAALADIAARAELPKPTTHRILQVLASRGYARQDADGRYLSGFMILSLSGQMSEMLDLEELALPVMHVLQRLLPETVHLSMLAGDHAVYVAKLDGQRPVRTASRIGDRLRLHCTSMGKAMLAYLLPEDRRRRLGTGELERTTPYTITSVGQLERELEEIRGRGFSIDNEENQEQIRGIDMFTITA